MPLQVIVICDVCPESPVSEQFDHIPKVKEIEGREWKVLIGKSKETTFICNTCLTWLRHTMKVLGNFDGEIDREDKWIKEFMEKMGSGIITVQDGVKPQPPIDVDNGPEIKSGKRVYVCRFGPRGLWKQWKLEGPPTKCKVSYAYKPDKGFNRFIVYHEENDHPKLYKKFGAHPVGNRRPIAFE